MSSQFVIHPEIRWLDRHWSPNARDKTGGNLQDRMYPPFLSLLMPDDFFHSHWMIYEKVGSLNPAWSLLLRDRNVSVTLANKFLTSICVYLRLL